MKLTQRMLRKIIAEEMARAGVGRRTIAEGSASRPVRVTPAYINRLIREEYAAYKNQKRIVEARRRRRLAEARKRRRLAEAKRRRDTVYYY